MAFHSEIYRIADNAMLIPLIQMLWLRGAPLLANIVPLLAGKTGPARRASVDNHERMLAAFQARDPIAAEEAMRRDLLGLSKIPSDWERLPLTAD